MARERRREETRREPLRGLFDPTGHRLSFGLLQLREARDDPFATSDNTFSAPDTCVKGNGSKLARDRSSFVKPRRPQDPTASGDGRCRPLANVSVGSSDRVPISFLPRRHPVFRPAMPCRRMCIVLISLARIHRDPSTMHHLVVPCTVRCLAIMLFSAFVALLATPAYAQTEVPSNWPLKASGTECGRRISPGVHGESFAECRFDGRRGL